MDRLIKTAIVTIFMAMASLTVIARDDRTAPAKVPLRFAWGADIGGDIEMSGHDLSTVGIDAGFGLEWRWIRFFGVNAAATIAVTNSTRMFPLTLNFRTDFCNTRQLLFADLRGGVSLVYMPGNARDQQPYGSAGLGVTLATGKTFSSHIIVGYTYIGRDKCYVGTRERICPGMSAATLRIGAMF